MYRVALSTFAAVWLILVAAAAAMAQVPAPPGGYPADTSDAFSWAQHLNHLTPELIVLFSVAGVAGVFVGMCALCVERKTGIALPRVYVVKDGDGVARTYFDPGFLASVVVAVGGSVLIDGRWWTGFIFGMAIGFAGPAFIRPLMERAFAAMRVAISFQGAEKALANAEGPDKSEGNVAADQPLKE